VICAKTLNITYESNYTNNDIFCSLVCLEHCSRNNGFDSSKTKTMIATIGAIVFDIFCLVACWIAVKMAHEQRRFNRKNGYQ
jgi:hypothetical protein